MQLVYKAANIAEAEIVKGMLEANGIHAHVGGYYLQGGVGEMATMDFANIHVPDDEIARARDIIQDYEDFTPEDTDGRAAPAPGTSPVKTAPLVLVLAALGMTLILYFVATSFQ